jgi:hypothetical protein
VARILGGWVPVRGARIPVQNPSDASYTIEKATGLIWQERSPVLLLEAREVCVPSLTGCRLGAFPGSPHRRRVCCWYPDSVISDFWTKDGISVAQCCQSIGLLPASIFWLNLPLHAQPLQMISPSKDPIN